MKTQLPIVTKHEANSGDCGSGRSKSSAERVAAATGSVQARLVNERGQCEMNDGIPNGDPLPVPASKAVEGKPMPNGLSDAFPVPLGWVSGGQAILDSLGVVLQANEAITVWLGVTPGNLVGKPFWPLIQKQFPECDENIQAAACGKDSFGKITLRSSQGGPPQCFNLEIARHDGAQENVTFVRLNSILPSLGELEESPWDEHLRTEEARRLMYSRLLRAEAQLENMVRRWPGVIFNQRPDFSFAFVSPRIEALTGITVEQWRAQAPLFWQVVHEADVEDLQQQYRRLSRANKTCSGTYRIRHARTGKVSYILEHREAVFAENGLLLGFEGVWLDVTRQTIAEKRLSSAAWKETLAMLTMGLAHDFSNIMSGIHSLSEAFQAEMESGHPFQEGLNLIQSNSRQASQLVHRILSLHRGRIGEHNYFNLNELVADTVELLRKIVPRRVEICAEYHAEPLPIYVDAIEFRQVMFNLALNAVDAMPHGGRLGLVTSRKTEMPALPHHQGELPRLPVVSLAMQDSGSGIPERHLNSIFDPFFTTKSVNKGSGLGLYNARLFVEKHHGAISVESTEAVGTTFTLWLSEADFTEAERFENRAGARRHTILMAAGAGMPSQSVVENLRHNGNYVVCASSLENAYELLASPDYQFSAVFVLLSSRSSPYAPLLGEIKRRRLPVNTVIQIVGRNQDEFDTQFLGQADLVFSPDTSSQEVLGRLRSLLDEPGKRPI